MAAIRNAGTDGNPFYSDFALPSDLNNPIVVRNGFPAGGLYGALAARTFGTYYSPLEHRDPYTQKYSLNLQISPSTFTALELGFTGQRALRSSMPHPLPSMTDGVRAGSAGVGDDGDRSVETERVAQIESLPLRLIMHHARGLLAA